MPATAPHPFTTAPHRTLVKLTIPVLFSLIAEPLTGLIDTGFVSRLGSAELAALGVGTIALTSFFWIFSFLSVSTQTEVGKAVGDGDMQRAAQATSLALLLAGVIGLILIVLIYPSADFLASLMGAKPAVQANAVIYMRWRLLGAPAVLFTIVTFGALRGHQHMQTALYLAVLINICNIVLDYVLIFGMGPVPALGIAGAAIASSISQWVGALVSLFIVRRNLGLSFYFNAAQMRSLIRVGGDLFIRTGTLTIFIALSTRAANQISTDSGAAHQIINQIWVFTALFLDAFAVTGQSLIAYFLGANNVKIARRVATTCAWWGLGSGIVLSLLMLFGRNTITAQLVPATAVAAFAPAWLLTTLFQPLNALAFATDGFHMGSGDYRYLRNAMLIASIAGTVALLSVGRVLPNTLLSVWIAATIWTSIRAIIGVIRIWPGVGNSPFQINIGQ